MDASHPPASPAEAQQRAAGPRRRQRPPAHTTTSVAISAFPTGGKGSGSEATCGLWSEQLQADVENLGDAESVDDRVTASNDLQQHKDDAMDAGCVVID